MCDYKRNVRFESLEIFDMQLIFFFFWTKFFDNPKFTQDF